MKYASLLPITLATVALTGCTMFPNTQTTPDMPLEENPPVAMIDEPAPTIAPSIPENTTITSEETTKKSTTPPTKAITPADKDAPKTTVSTEDLTKELDSFVDDITKGL